MGLGTTVASTLGSISSHQALGSLSSQKALKLAHMYLEKAWDESDSDIALVLYRETELSLVQAKKAAKHENNQAIMNGIGDAFINLSRLLEVRNRGSEADVIRKKAEKLGVRVRENVQKSSRPSSITPSLQGTLHSAGESQASGITYSSSLGRTPSNDTVVVEVSRHIFPENVDPPTREFKLPEPDERLNDAVQLAGCLGLLRAKIMSEDELQPIAHDWLQAIEKNQDEQDRLKTMANELIRVFKRDELKDVKAVAEVMHLAPVLSSDTFRDLLSEFYSGVDHSGLMKTHQLEGLAHLIHGADPGYLDADDLVKILGLLSNRLQETHRQSSHHMHQLTLAVSHVLDAMAETKVKDIDKKKLHEPLSLYLEELMKSTDPYMVYQAAYAYQALLCVPDDETKWQSAMRRTGKVVQGISSLVSAVKGLDLNKFIEGLGEIQEGFAGVSRIVEITITAYEQVTTLAQSGQGFMESLKQGFSFERKRDWYSALRGADAMIRDGELATFRELVCKAPCRLDPAFQWGVCQRLGEIAANSLWDSDIRGSAIAFLGEIYKEDAVWGQHVSIKQWILNILMQLASSSGGGLQLHIAVAEEQLRELKVNGDEKKRALYQKCCQSGPEPYPLKMARPELASPSLLDRVQSRPDVDVNIRLLRKQRTEGRGNSVYVPPQAKPKVQASDDTRFPLMERVKEFLESDQKVFLLLGDSGAGKSAFSLELEHELWRSYKNKADRIPLHINLPGIDKPEHDMVAKQLRRVEFTEPQIREMKHYRKLVLICDGYDESQQTHNLYMSNRMNQSGEWDVKMIVSCRTEYLGADYRDRFQPGDRNQQSKSSLFQEAVITPFTLNMVHAYIHRYVAIHQPLWQLEDYKQALELIPSLKDLVTNPFLMSLSLEVLPRMVDPGQHLSSRRVTRVELYDHFVEQWLERNKKRLGEMGMAPQAREEFERLIAEGFTVNGIGYMKKFALAIYKEQDGQPVVEYSQLVDEGTWKDEFFKFRDKQLLHEASPLARSGNQHRFIHRSLLEYSLSRAIFDPEDRKNRIPTEALLGRRGSLSSTLSFEIQDGTEQTAWIGKEPDFDSPLVSRSFVKDYSFLHFLEERVLQEPMFKEQLLKYIEYSKKDAKWRKAAANAITILVRAGVQFIGADLRGIRIPGADLSFGIFDSAQLQDADLRKVNLEYVAMRKTDLRRAQMTGVQFGEMPSLEVHSAVYSCAYSPDGKLFAVGSEYISLYTTSNWKRIGERRSGGVRCIIYSPRGDQVAACGYDSTVHLLDSETGSLLGTLTDNTNYVLSVAYSPQGDRIASVSGDGRVRLWDVASGKCRHTFTGLHSSIKCVEYSPNDHQIAAGGEDRRAYLWNTETGATHILSGHRGIVLIIKYSSRGDRVASASEDTTVRIWNVDTGACCHILTGHRGTVLAINYSSRGDQVASASEDTTARIWDVETGTCRHILIGHISPITSVAFSPKGDQIVSGSTDKTAKLWDTETGHCRQTLTGHTGSVNCVAFSPGGDHIASGSEDRTVRLCGISSRPVSSSHSAELYGVKCSSRGDLVASCGLDGIIRFWSADTGAHRLTLNGHNDSVFNIAFSPQGDLIASGSADMTVRLWDVDSGACLQILIGHTDYVVDVAYFPQGDMIASGSIDKSVRLWDTATRECRSVFTGLSGVMSVSISPDGDQIASGTREHLVRIWDPKTGVCSGTLEYFDSRALEVAYLPQGNQLASAGHGKTIFIWDMKTRRRRLILNGHTDRVRCLAFSPQGDLLASGCCDMTVRLWDVVSGRCLTVIESFRGPVYSVVWVTTSGTNYLVTGSGDGSLLKWEIVKEAEQYSARLLWSAVNGTLTLAGASIQDVRGLSPINKQLLEQRGAIGKTSAGLVS